MRKLVIKQPTIADNVVTCEFEYNNEIYRNSYEFPSDIPSEMADSRLLLWLSVITSMGMFSLDYFKIMECEFYLDSSEIQFFEKIFYLGLGEFRYVNGIPIDTKTVVKTISKPENKASIHAVASLKGNGLRPLLLNGGGKDGSASAFLLTEADIDFTWFQRGDSVAQRSVTSTWKAPVFAVARNLDEKRKGKYSGHRPMSAGIAILSTFTAQAFGYSDVIASNEASANEGNMLIGDFSLNHQYSKSLEFEQDFGALLTSHNIEIKYFSLLRSLHEIQIAKIVAKLNKKQLSAITSCNNGTSTGTWCMNCAKCAFVVLIITAVDPDTAIKIWKKQAINEPALIPYLIELADPSVPKPLECVGTVPECQIALSMLKKHQNLVLSTSINNLVAEFGTKSKLEIENFMNNYEIDVLPEKYTSVRDKLIVIHQLANGRSLLE